MEQKNPFKGNLRASSKIGFADNWNSISGGIVKIKNKNLSNSNNNSQKINYLGNKMPVSLSTTYFSSPRTHFDMPLQYVKGNVCNSVERFERNWSELDEFPTFNIESKRLLIKLL